MYPSPFDDDMSFDELRDITVKYLVSQIYSLDFAFREFGKKNDNSSRQRFEEIHDGFRKIAKISTALYVAHVNEEIISKQLTDYLTKSKPKKRKKIKKKKIDY